MIVDVGHKKSFETISGVYNVKQIIASIHANNWVICTSLLYLTFIMNSLIIFGKICFIWWLLMENLSANQLLGTSINDQYRIIEDVEKYVRWLIKLFFICPWITVIIWFDVYKKKMIMLLDLQKKCDNVIYWISPMGMRGLLFKTPAVLYIAKYFKNWNSSTLGYIFERNLFHHHECIMNSFKRQNAQNDIYIKKTRIKIASIMVPRKNEITV